MIIDISNSLKLIKCNPLNENIDDCLPGLLTKVPFSAGDLKDLGKNFLIGHKKCLYGIGIFCKCANTRKR